MNIDTKALPIWGWIAHHRESGGRPIIADPGRAAMLPRTEGWDVFPVCRVDDAADRIAALEEQLHLTNVDALQAEAERNELASELRQAMDERDAAQAEARELRAEIESEEKRFNAQQDLLYRVINERDVLQFELARVRELPAKWRAAPQNPDEPLLAMAADELDAALSQPAEQHDPLAVSDHCGERGEPEPECACDERIEDYRESKQEGKE